MTSLVRLSINPVNEQTESKPFIANSGRSDAVPNAGFFESMLSVVSVSAQFPDNCFCEVGLVGHRLAPFRLEPPKKARPTKLPMHKPSVVLGAQLDKENAA